MDPNPFAEKSSKPTEESIKKVFGDTYPFYKELSDLSSEFKSKWHFYQRSGWLKKVHDNKKALYYIIPENGSFTTGLTIREQEKTDFLKDPELNYLQEKLNTAKKYPEGYALQFFITDTESFSGLYTLIEKLIIKRR